VLDVAGGNGGSPRTDEYGAGEREIYGGHAAKFTNVRGAPKPGCGSDAWVCDLYADRQMHTIAAD